tara:strand:+ start:24188 stop:25690 length:1503 start_codon:yes stop_codon:yes gene_type:complete
MDIQTSTENLFDHKADTYIVYLPTNNRPLSGETAIADQQLRGAISQARVNKLFHGKSGHFLEFPTPTRSKAKRIIVLEIEDKPDEININLLRTFMGTFSRQVRATKTDHVVMAPPAGAWKSLSDSDYGLAVAEGLILGLYKFNEHHTKKDTASKFDVTLLAKSRSQLAAISDGVTKGKILAESTNSARTLGNQPANFMTPTLMAQNAESLANKYNLECQVIEQDEAEQLGMGSYLSVAHGSVEPPKFIILKYHGLPRHGNYLTLIGKGITFDTGGISLKPAAGMEAMKWDMSGAAVVINAIAAIAQLKPKINVMAIAPCTENMPSGSATKPGDVFYAMDGQSIEVANTDAEGRLVLADGIAYARKNGATRIIDVATLTGAMGIALGNVRVGGFSNNTRLWNEFENASSATGEKYWRLPLDKEYHDQIKSDVADIKNTGGRGAGSITAAKFLEAFAGDTPWIHLDIAGVMNVNSTNGEWVKGMAGIPLRTLVQLALNRARS